MGFFLANIDSLSVPYGTPFLKPTTEITTTIEEIRTISRSLARDLVRIEALVH